MATPIVRHALVGAGVGRFVFKSLQRGGVWTLAGALPIFNRINYRRGCFMKNVKNGKTQNGGN